MGPDPAVTSRGLTLWQVRSGRARPLRPPAGERFSTSFPQKAMARGQTPGRGCTRHVGGLTPVVAVVDVAGRARPPHYTGSR